FRPTRRTASLAIAAAVAAPSSIIKARAEEPAWRHGMALLGELKYPAGFKHYDFVNPQAPKGGVVRSLAIGGTFDNFNFAVDGAKGNFATSIILTSDTLLVDSMDEPTAAYGLLAESLRYPSNVAWATFRLRGEARWHDGKPVTPEDVIFSFEA